MIGREGFLFWMARGKTSNAKEWFGAGVGGHAGHASTAGGGMRQGLGWHKVVRATRTESEACECVRAPMVRRGRY